MPNKQIIEFLQKAEYPYKIRDRDGNTAVLCDMQPLLEGDYCAIYRFDIGCKCVSLNEIKYYKVIEAKLVVNEFNL